MKLVSLTMRNFMPYRGEQKIVFPDNPTKNVLLIVGDNMKGKTSILNAIRWGFYGNAMGRHLRPIPLNHLHNSDACLAGDWEMEVAIQFEVDGHKYDLRRRSIKKRLVSDPTRPEDFEVQDLLQRDGMAISGYQIEAEINRFAPEQVSRFFLFDGELLQEYETLLIEGSEQGRRIKEAIEQVLGVPALINGRNEAATLLKKAQKQQNADLAHLKGAEGHIERQSRLQSDSESLEEDLRKLKEQNKSNKDEISVLDDDIEKNDSIYKAKITLNERERRKDEIEKEIAALNSDRLGLVSRAWRDLLTPKIQVRRDRLLSEQSLISEKLSLRSSIELEAAQVRKIIEDSICPTCKQTVNPEKSSQAKTQLIALEEKLREAVPSLESFNTLSAELEALNKIVSQNVGDRIHDKDRQINRLEIELTKVLNESDALKEEIKGHDTLDIIRKRGLRDALIKEEKKIEMAIADDERKLDKAKQELAMIDKQLKNIPEARAKRSSTLVELYAGLERAFTESIEKLRDNLRKHVEAKSNEAFRAMTTQDSYKGLRINDNYGLSILDDQGRVVPVRSAGAEQVVALSLIDGLSHTGRAAGPIVMDTPFGRLDLKHRDNILKYLPSATSQLILLVHDGEIRVETDLTPIAHQIGGVYHIREKSPRHSIIERSAS